MQIHLSLPARINLLGNPSDALEGDFATITSAIDIRAHLLIEPSTAGLTLVAIPEAAPTANDLTAISPCLELKQVRMPLPVDGPCRLVAGAINRLYGYSAEFRAKFTPALTDASPGSGLRITTWSKVPRQSGLGGSSLFVLLTLAGLRDFYHLDPGKHNHYVLAELAQRTEAQELGITCGYADRYVPLFGGLNYLDYRGKLDQGFIQQEPYATMERLDGHVGELPLLAVTTGIEHDSGDVHGRLRPRYMQEFSTWQRNGGAKPAMLRLAEGIYETAWRGKIALLENDLTTFGTLMNRNHQLVDEMMTYCGFTQGAGWANNALIEAALEAGALGAKLTGAGGGGSVFALFSPGQEAVLRQAWEAATEHHNLRNAVIFRPRLATQGLRQEED